MTYTTLYEFIETETKETQIEGYKFIRKYGVETLYGKIIKLLEKTSYPMSIGEIAYELNEERSTISPRIKELREEIGAIKSAGKRKSYVSNLTNEVWQLVENHNEVVELIN